MKDEMNEKICKDKEYKNIFIFNGEELEADECYTSKYGSYCKKDNITYENVAYKTEYVKCNKYIEYKENIFDTIYLYCTPIICIFILINLLFKIAKMDWNLKK